MERELLLLGLLRQQERHGYELHDFIEKTMQTCVDLKKPTAYYLLDKLAQQGYIGETEKRIGNRPPRRVYYLTAAGEEKYQDLLRQNLRSYTPARFADLVGLAFLDDLPPEEAASLLCQRRDDMAQLLAESAAAPRHAGSHQYVIDHHKTHLRAEIAWLDNVLRQLEAQIGD